MPHLYAIIISALISVSTWVLRHLLHLLLDILKEVRADLKALTVRVANLERNSE